MKTGRWSKTNIAKHAAIYGIDGTCWIGSKDWPGIWSYEHEVEDMDGSKKKLEINEFKLVLEFADGTYYSTPNE